MDPSQPISFVTAQAHDVEALWASCLDIARVRRQASRGGTPSNDSVAPPIPWTDEDGFALDGTWTPPAQELFALLKPILDASRRSVPWAIGQLGQSLDGCIATRDGDSHYVNGAGVLTHLHRLRALCDAVIVGAGTAAIDDPQLTTRLVPGEHPVRVILDTDLRLGRGLKVFSDGQAPTLLACDERRMPEAVERFGATQVLGVPGLLADDGNPRLAALVAALGRRGLDMLFVEGGGVTVSRFIAQGCLDRLHLSIAPVLIGEGRRGLQVPQSGAMRDCLRLRSRVFRFDEDVLWDLDLRSPEPRS
ncbi:Riboflavin-specific deaminase C-terminal domain-containing protein [Burkholderiales bacterium 8X]|nr:Riboflavin-specific deaminase C-terminal domain-containing protein [Burkholderiales bacterium 8X]